MMTEALPPAIVAPLHDLATELTNWAWSHPDPSLATIEQQVMAQVRAVLPTLLAAVVGLTTRSLASHRAPSRLPCPGCGTPVRVQSWRSRQVQTTCGPLAIERPWYTCRGCQHGWSPTDQTLEVAPHHRLSVGVHAQVARLGATTTFREAADLLAFLTGTPLSPETVRAHTEAEGTIREAAQQDAIAQVQQTGEVAAVEEAPGTLVVETDGVMVRYRDGWHEVKLGVVGGQQDGRLREVSYVAARAEAERFGPRLLAEAARRGALTVVGWEDARHDIARLRPVAVVGDGAVWIWNLAADHFGTRVEIVDVYHASEHLWTLARALFGAETTEAATWADTQIGDLWEHGATWIHPVLAALDPATETEAKVLHQERGYFRTNAARMDYPTFRAQGLPCGSGAVEAAAKHLVQQRMKRPGSRWSEAGAKAVLTLRADLLSYRRLAA
ncbi:MAG: ISKra4 family transposase [Chloroflexota bacterium]